MNNFKFKSFLVFIGCVVFSYLFSAFKEPTGGYGTRPAGLAGAYTAVSDDSNAVFYNPAGVRNINSIEGNFMYGMLYAGLGKDVNISLNNISVLYPVFKLSSVVGFGWSELNSENYKENTLTFSYVPNLQILPEEFSFGINFKYLQHSYSLDERSRDDEVFAKVTSKGSFSADLGFLVKFNSLCCGLLLKNLIPADVGLDKEDIIPADYRLAVAYKKSDFVYSIEIGYRSQNWGEEKDKITYYTAAEKFFFNKLLAFRLGANLTEYTAGFSILLPSKFLDLQIDYAFILPVYIENSVGTHRIGLVVKRTMLEQKQQSDDAKKVPQPKFSLQVIPEKCYITIAPEEVPVNIYFNIVCPAKNVSLCELKIIDEQGRIIKTYTQTSKPLPRQIIWDGKIGTDYAPEGRYSAVLTYIDATGITTTLVESFEIIHKVIEPEKIVEVKEIIKEVPKEVKVVEEEKFIRLRIQSSVLFDHNSAELSKSAIKVLQNIVELLKNYPENRIIIEGHTDSVGSDEYNDKLSYARANAVKEFLVSNGVLPERIVEVKGYGERNPIASNKTASGRAMNRRVEILIVK